MVDWVINGILLLCFYPILLILYFCLKKQGKYKDGKVLGVALHPAAWEAEGAQEICRRFLRSLRRITGGLAVIPFSGLLLPWISLFLMVLLFWTVAAIVLPYFPFIRAHHELIRWRQEQGWETAFPKAGQAVSGGEEKTEPVLYLLLICLLVGLLPLISTASKGKITGELAPVIVYWAGNLLLILALFLVSLKSKGTQSITNLADAAEAIRKREWFSCAFFSSLMAAAGNWCVWLGAGNLTWLLVAGGFFYLLIGLRVFWTVFLTWKKQERMKRDQGIDSISAQEDSWIDGMIYCNPSDSRFLVNDPVGVGTTVNIGKRSGRILTGFSVALIALMPLLGYWLVAEEFTPIRWEITPEAVILRHVWEEDQILFQDVQSVEWLDSLPKISRQKGSSIGEMRKGKYRVEGMGTCSLYLNRKDEKYLLIRTGEKTYLVNGEQESDTESLYLNFEKIGIFSRGTSYNELDAFKKRNIGGIVWREGFG